MEALLLTLLIFIQDESDYDVAEFLTHDRPLPTVVLDDPKAIKLMAGVHASLDVQAMYEREANRIWLPWTIDADTPKGKSLIVHELVHMLQHEVPNKEFECLKAREFEAYEIQEAYLLEKTGESNVQWLDVIAFSMCPPPFAPPNR